jgi:hypothetical protein
VFDLRVNNAKGPNARPLEHNVGLPSCEKFRFLPHTWKTELNGTVVRTIDNSKYFYKHDTSLDPSLSFIMDGKSSNNFQHIACPGNCHFSLVLRHLAEQHAKIVCDERYT